MCDEKIHTMGNLCCSLVSNKLYRNILHILRLKVVFVVVVVFADNVIIEVIITWTSLKEIADWKPVYKCFVVSVLLSASV